MVVEGSKLNGVNLTILVIIDLLEEVVELLVSIYFDGKILAGLLEFLLSEVPLVADVVLLEFVLVWGVGVSVVYDLVVDDFSVRVGGVHVVRLGVVDDSGVGGVHVVRLLVVDDSGGYGVLAPDAVPDILRGGGGLSVVLVLAGPVRSAHNWGVTLDDVALPQALCLVSVSVDSGVVAHVDLVVGLVLLVGIELLELFNIPRDGRIFVVVLVDLEGLREGVLKSHQLACLIELVRVDMALSVLTNLVEDVFSF